MNYTIATFFLVNTLLFITLTDVVRPHIKNIAFRFLQVALLVSSLWAASFALIDESGYISDTRPASEETILEIKLLKSWLSSKNMKAFSEEMAYVGKDGVITQVEADYLLGMVEYFALQKLKSTLKDEEVKNKKCLLGD